MVFLFACGAFGAAPFGRGAFFAVGAFEAAPLADEALLGGLFPCGALGGAPLTDCAFCTVCESLVVLQSYIEL